MTIECYLDEDGIVYHHDPSVQTAEAAAANIAAMEAVMANATSHLMIVDLNGVTGVTREARALFRDFAMRTTGPDADPRWTTCFAGGSPFLRTVVKFILVAARRSEWLGFQPTREAARDWLLAHYDGARNDGVQNG